MIAATQQRMGGGYLESFADVEKSGARHDVPWLKELREKALARFCEVGFPTTHTEEWRFTDVSAVARTAYRLARNERVPISNPELQANRLTLSSCDLVFVNGHFAPELSSLDKLPPGVDVSSLAQQLRQDPAVLEPYLGRFLDTRRDPFCALNTAFLHDGAWVRIAKGVILADPIYVRFISTGSLVPTMSHSRNLVVVGAGSEITMIEEHLSLNGDASFRTAATELVAEDNAHVSHYIIEQVNTRAYFFSTVRIEQRRNVNVNLHSVLTGAALARHSVHPVLAGEGGECMINGLFIGAGQQHLDNFMLVDHASPHCSSRQFYNGILDDEARGVFHGRIVVHKSAQKTDARQTNRNLLLSDDAQMDTKPQLEIFADDVKCTHGATIGQIEEGALFYLRSRGIDQDSARHLLILAFAGECLERMNKGPARERVEEIVRDRLSRLARTVPDQSSGADETWSGHEAQRVVS